MKNYCFISISFRVNHRIGTEYAQKALAEIGCSEGWHDPPTPTGFAYFYITLNVEDSRFKNLWNWLAKEKIEYSERWERIYSLSELEQYPFVELVIRLAGRDIDRPKRDTYDFSKGCSLCGTGSPQIKPLEIFPSKLPKKNPVCPTLHDHLLVSQSIRDGILDLDPTGLELRQVLSTRGEPVNWWQLIPTIEMPPVSSTTKAIKRSTSLSSSPCEKCQRDCWFHNSSHELAMITYDRRDMDFNSAPDCASTYECFGKSGFNTTQYLAHGLILVSPRIYKVLFKECKSAVQYSKPVEIIDR
jgi:hypothetical protein